MHDRAWQILEIAGDLGVFCTHHIYEALGGEERSATVRPTLTMLSERTPYMQQMEPVWTPGYEWERSYKVTKPGQIALRQRAAACR